MASVSEEKTKGLTADKLMITSYQEHCKYKAFRSLQTRKNNI